MSRGLDGYFDNRALALCSFEGPLRSGLHRFPVAMARGKHLFPFRTEPLSPSAPMVLGPQGPGRVGRRRFLSRSPVHTSVWAGFRRCPGYALLECRFGGLATSRWRRERF
jgi:hypothetical protein